MATKFEPFSPAGGTITINPVDGSITVTSTASPNQFDGAAPIAYQWTYQAGISFRPGTCGRLSVLNKSGGGDYPYPHYKAYVSDCVGTGFSATTSGDAFAFVDGKSTVSFFIRQINPFSITFNIIDDQGIAPIHDGAVSCPFNYLSNDPITTQRPISLFKGEKREEVTDFSLDTPAGSLDFTRSYRQSKLIALDPKYKYMGLGWKHNHDFNLTENTGVTPNTLIVRVANGGEVHFTLTTTNHYEGDAGSVSFVDVNPGSDYDPLTNLARYILTAADKSLYLFDSTGYLRRRRWPNGEYWDYNYTSGKLSAVVDSAYDLNGSGLYRQLQFSYISNPGQFNDGQLWRVGDQTASGLSGGSPSGRYIEFGYINEKLNGATTGNLNALLATVRDVRGNVWTYDWYGQHSGESDTNQKNFLTSQLSPLVDTNGDNTADTPTTLKALTYAMTGAVINGITQKSGARGTSPALVEETLAFQPNGQNITTQTVAGKTTIHHFFGGLYRGSELPGNNGKYAVQNLDNTFRPAQQTDANGNPTQLTWSTDGKRLNQVTDALNHTTGFIYNTDDTLQSSLDAQGRTTLYTYGDLVNPRQPTRIQVIDGDGHTLLSWQEFSYDAKGRTLTEQTLDPKNPAVILQQIQREYYTSGNGNGLLYRTTQKDISGSNDVITTYSYDSAGRVTKTQQSSNFGSCAISFTVFDAAGNVVASLCNYDPGSNADPTTVAQALALYNPRDPNKNRVTTSEYDALGRRIKTTVDAAASFAMTTLTVYDALNRVVRTISNYVASPVVPQPYIAPRTAFPHGSNNDQNLVSDTFYNARGMVKRQVDVLGNVTLYGYDDAGRLVKTVQSASQDSYNNDYTDAASDPALARYVPGSRVDQDVITTQAYDANGNLVKSTDVLGNVTLSGYDALNRLVKSVRSASQPNYNLMADPSLSQYVASSAPDQDMIDTTDYDALGRVIRTRRLLDNRPTDQWETTLYGYDGLGRQVRVIRSASQPNYNVTNDPSLSQYPLSDNSDQDSVSLTAYDASHRVLYSEDALGNRTWAAYDGLGRPVKTIVNPMGSATDNGVHDPRSPVYNPVINVADRDLISSTSYDSDGRVQYTQDVLGRRNWPVYDSLGRVIKNVTNASGNATDGRLHDPRSPVYARSGNTDQDILAQTIYDAQGRVSATLDTRGNQTRYDYDRLGRRIRTITNYVDGISNNSIPDEDRMMTTTYDLAGRVVSSLDAAGLETRSTYDALGRRTKIIANYSDGRFNPNVPDEDLISTTSYNRAGQVVATTDARGTQSAFTYDRAGRRLTVTQAAGTALATTAYTCYDKAGRVVRTIQNYVPQSNSSGQLVSPDAQDERGSWLFAPASNGLNNDTNLITRLAYDRSSRPIIVTDPLGNTTLTTYFKDGQVNSLTDPEGIVTAYRYDGLRRRTRVVQSYLANGDDPSRWYWNAGWKRSDGTAIVHGSHNDQNIIVDVAYDQGGRVASLRDPLGSLTTYTYDLLDRRTGLVNPLNQQWLTTYFNVDNKTRTVMTYPGVNSGGSSYTVQRDFDRLGRLATLSYGAPATTPDIKMTYNTAGDRTRMTEYSGAGFTTPVRDTQYSYDRLHRLTQAAFDTDGSGSIDESVSYAYDAGGLRTQMTLPGSLNLSYAYNAKGQLIGLTDWDGQYTQFLYDALGRHVVTQRANGLYSRYSYDAGGRLRELRHHDRNKTLARFLYQVDHRGNRTQAFEELAHPASVVQTIGIADGAVSYYKGTWTTNGSYKQTTQFSSAMTISFTGNEAVLTLGTGTDHGIYDVYIDGSLWESFDGYSTTGTDRLINIYLDKRLDQTDVHVIDIGCRAEKNKNSSGYTLRFKQLVILSTVYDRQTLNYGYDALARLLTASYAGVSPTRSYQYAFDRAGNRTQQVVTIGGTPTTTDYEYTTANQILRSRVNAGAWTNFTYDNNGNLTSDGTNSYTWDRANRLLSMGGASYQYDGEGRRVQQTVSATVTKYLLDIQPGLAVVLSETTGANTMRYVHSPRGIHAHKDTGGNWEWMVQDGLGSVCEVVDNSVGVLESRNYDPYGNPFGATGTSQTGYGFTGELVDGSGLLDLRARRYNAGLGTFASLDPFEGMPNRAMSLNGYSWVEGNVVNAVDPSGKCATPTDYVNNTFCGTSIIVSSVQMQATPDSSCDCCADGWQKDLCKLLTLSLPNILGCPCNSAGIDCRGADMNSAPPNVQNAWNTTITNLQKNATQLTVNGYTFPSGKQLVDAISAYGITVRVYPQVCKPGAAGYYEGSTNTLNLNVNAVLPPNPPVYDSVLVMHELMHGYLGNACPILFNGPHAENALNELLAYYISHHTFGGDEFGVVSDGLEPFRGADLYTFRQRIAATDTYAGIDYLPPDYDANRATCPLLALPSIIGNIAPKP